MGNDADDYDFTGRLPPCGFVRQNDLVGVRAKPGRPSKRGILPFTAGTLWRQVNIGKFPAPVKLSPGVTAWRVEEVRAWLAEHGALPIPSLEVKNQTITASQAKAISPEPNRIPPPPPSIAEIKQFEDGLVKDANAWRNAELVRAYAAHIAISLPASTELLTWLSRAEMLASRLDPTTEVKRELAAQAARDAYLRSPVKSKKR